MRIAVTTVRKRVELFDIISTTFRRESRKSDYFGVVINGGVRCLDNDFDNCTGCGQAVSASLP